MAFRALRKLQAADNSLLNHQNAQGNDTDDTILENPKRPFVNSYDILCGNETASDSEAKEDDGAESTLPISQNELVAPPDDGEGKDEAGAKDSLKRKKKKRKKRAKIFKQKSTEEELEAEDELEEALRLNALAEHFVPESPDVANNKPLFSVEYRFLNAENEMRKLFGSKVVQADDHRHHKTRNRGGGRHQRIFSSSKFAAAQHHFTNIGISMKLLECQGGVQFFTFEHGVSYRKVQFAFLDAVDSLNPDNIVAVLNDNPFHVDSLIQLSDISKAGEDSKMAAELIERALFILESSFHGSFNLAHSNCRLDYRRAENRSFYICLFKHLVFVGDRGCCRTALEFCKLILGLDPDKDPLAITLMLDFYAIRAEEYDYLIQFYYKLNPSRNLYQLPNFAYGVALATFLKAKKLRGDAKLELEADDLLQMALVMFPSLLTPLLEACSVKPDSKVVKHDFFGPKSQINQPAGLEQLVKLYVLRSYHLWKEASVVAWLERNVSLVLARVDAGDGLVKSCSEKRKLRYKGPTPRNIIRHILLSSIKDSTINLPREIQNNPIMSYDPLPPTDSIVTYTRPPRRPTNEPTQLLEGNTLNLFLRSLLPNFGQAQDNEPGPVADGADRGAVGGAEAGEHAPNDLRRSVTSLLDAMRDLLTSVNINQQGEDIEDADNSSSDDEN